MTRTLLGIVATICIAMSAVAWGGDTEWPRVQSGSYQDMPDGQFVENFADLEESCRKPLSERDEHVAELKKQHSDRSAKSIHETEHQQCLGVLSSRMSLARLYGYSMHADEAVDPAFWQHLDQARTNLQ